MQLARVVGTVTATAKDAGLTGHALLLCELEGGGAEVATDTVGAGVGDSVLITRGSAARIPAGAAGAPVDAAIVAVVDAVTRAKS